MNVSQEGEALLHYFESCRLEAYPDPGTGGDPWTIGWGHTGPEVVPGLVWTQEMADAAFRNDLSRFERDVDSLLDVPVSQGQFDALVSFAYNVGSDIDADDVAEGLGDSTLLKKLNRGDYEGASLEFPKWCRAGGREMLGLKRRRWAEQALFLGEDWREAARRSA